MKYTINDIAKLAKVGKSTVSRVLNNDPNVSESTRQAIQSVIDSVGFQPNRSARAMRGAGDHVVGIIVTRLHSSSESQTLSAILAALYQKNITPLIVESQFQPEIVNRHFQLFKQRQVNGVILFGFSQLSSTTLKQWKAPLVSVARPYPQICSVYYDDQNAVNTLMTKLYAQGHRQIAYLGITDQDETTGKLRYQTYLDYCQKWQLPINAYQTELGAENGYQAMQTLFEHPVSAVLCATNSLAIGAFKYMQEKGQQRPLACVGQNDLLQFIVPDFIGLDFGYSQAGTYAVELLLAQLAGDLSIKQKRIDCQLS